MLLTMLALMHWAAASAADPDIQPIKPAAIHDNVLPSRTVCNAQVRVVGGVSDVENGLSIDFTGGPAKVWVSHGMDVDLSEDRCISEVLIKTYLDERGCILSMRFHGNGAGTSMTLTEALLEADSFCPGWTNENEGNYRSKPGRNELRMSLSQGNVTDRIADRSCIDLGMAVSGDLSLNDRSKRTDLSFKSFTVQGVFDSVGDPLGICSPPGTPATTARPQRTTTSGNTEGRYDADLVGMAGFDLGLYSYNLAAASTRFANVTFGGRVTPPARAYGFSTFVRYAQAWTGGEIRYRSNYTSVNVGSSNDTASLSTFDLPLVWIVRKEFDTKFAAFRPGLRLGTSFADSPVFFNGTKNDASASGMYFEPSRVFSGLVGAEIDVRVTDRGYSRAWLDMRFARFSAYSQIGGGMEFSYTLAPPVFANASMSFERRSMLLRGPNGGPQNALGTIDDHMTRFTIEFGYMR